MLENTFVPTPEDERLMDIKKVEADFYSGATSNKVHKRLRAALDADDRDLFESLKVKFAKIPKKPSSSKSRPTKKQKRQKKKNRAKK